MKKSFYGIREFMIGFLITAGASALALVAINQFLSQLMFTDREAQFINTLSSRIFEDGLVFIPVIGQILPFIVGTVLVISYVKPYYNKSPESLNSKQQARVVRSPFFLSFFGAVSWAVGFVFNVTSILVLRQNYPGHIMLKSLIFLTSQSILVFILSFYLLEWYYREKIIPRAFPQNTLRHIPQVKQDRIGRRFSTFMLAVYGFPTVVFTNIIFTASAQEDDPLPLEILIPMGALILGMTLVFILLKSLVSRSIEGPVQRMVAMTKKIEAGAFDVSTRIQSTDQLGHLGESLNDMARGLVERELIRDTLGRMVDPSIRDYLLQGNTKLGGEFLDCSILFVDIRGYTSMSEGRSPEEIVQWLNRFFDRCHGAIKAHDGVVNKYIGDAVMAIFGAPIKIDNHAQGAVRAAFGILKALAELNKELLRAGEPEITVRIGIHSGRVLAGNIGASERMEYTVIGDAVNLASRLEAQCREYNTDLLISKEVFDRLEDRDVSNIWGRRGSKAESKKYLFMD
jgi:adenylate cyclase